VILLDVEQGSSDWLKARLGIPTASAFDKILTPATRKASTQAHGYMRTLLAEWLTGENSDAGSSGFMDRGTQLEPLARSWYAYERGVTVQKVGLVLRDDRMTGASPDGLVDEDGTLEIKCPAASTHVGYLLDGLPSSYFAQIQGALWLTGRKWCDLLSFHPDPDRIPPVVKRFERDEEYIAALDAAVSTFVEHLLRQRTVLIELGCVPEKRALLKPNMRDEDPF
jgi:predicted phage-related endonuclease